MGIYRPSRNIEASLIDYIGEELISASFTNVNVEKSFAEVYGLDLPTVLVQTSDTEHTKVGIGAESTWRNTAVIIDIFAVNDGNRLDLKDFLVDILRGGCPYYEYETANGVVSSKTQNGRLRVISIDDNIVNLAIDKDNLDTHDRYRHELVLEVSTGKVET